MATGKGQYCSNQLWQITNNSEKLLKADFPILSAETPISLMIRGFALIPWKEVHFENSGFILKESYAIAMGNYFFVDMEDNKTKVEYTFGFYHSKDGSLKINLHHSSIPYAS